MSCAVCGSECGPLKGAAKSWSCAGKMASQSRKANVKREVLRTRFDNPHKANARVAAYHDDLMALPPNARVLDLYGGGVSAEWIRKLRPDIDLVVAETDRTLWPALRADAKRHGFTAICGDFDLAANPFDLILLDLCGEIVTAFDSVQRACTKLRQPEWTAEFRRERPTTALYVTVMRQDRNGRAELKKEVRLAATEGILRAAGGADAVLVHSYRQAGGKGTADIWRLGASYTEQSRLRESEFRERLEGRQWHARRIDSFWEWPDVLRVERPCAAGTCRCAAHRYVTHAEQEIEARRYSDWTLAQSRSADIVFASAIDKALSSVILSDVSGTSADA